ncbi:MAG: hypothetical protein JEZ02_14490 [Desulfatibacillum sp.]|nr:hypothetical protein [Desulfatibacillum sp.]
MPKKIFILVAVSLLATAMPCIGADTPSETRDALFLDGDMITLELAADFLTQTSTLGMEEMGDNHLQAMVCTPHALPRKLFFQVLCDCATDPETKISDLEILALNEDGDRSGETDGKTCLSLRDVNQDATSAGFFFRNPAADASKVSFPAPDPDVLATGALPDGWTTRILRSGSVSF